MHHSHSFPRKPTGPPLCAVPGHFAAFTRSPGIAAYLAEVLRHCPRGGRACEIGCGDGYASTWLSLRGIHALGLDPDPHQVERARHVNNLLHGHAHFHPLNPTNIALSIDHALRITDHGSQHPSTINHQPSTIPPVSPSPCPPVSPSRPYIVLHHHNLLHCFPLPVIHAHLAHQLALAEWVIFTVPSVYFPGEPGPNRERLLPLEEWQRILQPFAIEDLRYHGDPASSSRDHLLCILRSTTQPAHRVAQASAPQFSEPIAYELRITDYEDPQPSTINHQPLTINH